MARKCLPERFLTEVETVVLETDPSAVVEGRWREQEARYSLAGLDAATRFYAAVALYVQGQLI